MIEEYHIAEVKPSVYVGTNSIGNYELTDKLNKARRFNEKSRAEWVARKFFGEVKKLKVTTAVEQP